MNSRQFKKQLLLNSPYLALGLLATNLGEAWRMAAGVNVFEKIQSMVLDNMLAAAFANLAPSFYPSDFFVGLIFGVAVRIAVYLKGNQMIISKNPQFTGISARQQLEFTTHLLLTD